MAVGRAIALQDYQASQRAHRNRIAQSAAAGWAAMGNQELAAQALKDIEEEMGDISIRGDTHNHFIQQPQQQIPGPTPSPTPTTPPATDSNGLKGYLLPAALGAALVGGGAGTYALVDYFTSEHPPAVVQPVDPNDFKLGVEVRDR